LIGTFGLLAFGAALRPALFQVDRKGVLLVAGVGGLLVALFEVAYQFGIAGAGVAGAAALLYTAPVIVAVFAQPLLGEPLTWARLALAVTVMIGAALTVTGGSHAAPGAHASLGAGVAGGLLAAVSYAGTTLLARWAVPRYGVIKVLFLELVGGTVLLGVILTVAGRPPAPPPTMAGWAYIAALTLGTVWLANFAFFAAVRRIQAAPTSVAATIEPVVGALLALALFSQRLTLFGWVGLFMVVGGVAAGYWREVFPERGAEPAGVTVPEGR
jgi:drug/metabolite transporter (DMT)-like permease